MAQVRDIAQKKMADLKLRTWRRVPDARRLGPIDGP